MVCHSITLYVWRAPLSNVYCSEPNKTKQNGKHDEAEPEAEEEGFTYKEEVKQVGYFQIFRYATNTDRLLYVIGLLAAVATGLTTPANSLIFGNLANVSWNENTPPLNL